MKKFRRLTAEFFFHDFYFQYPILLFQRIRYRRYGYGEGCKTGHTSFFGKEKTKPQIIYLRGSCRSKDFHQRSCSHRKVIKPNHVYNKSKSLEISTLEGYWKRILRKKWRGRQFLAKNTRLWLLSNLRILLIQLESTPLRSLSNFSLKLDTLDRKI